MVKIPIWRTIRESYEYLIANIGIVFGLTWLAALFDTSVNYIFSEHVGLFDQSKSATRIGLTLIAFVLHELLYSIAAVGLTRRLLGLQSESKTVHFEFGRAEWNLVLATAGCISLTTILTMLGLLVLALLYVLTKLPVWIFGGAMILAIVAVMAFVTVRYLFFLPIAAVLAPDQRLGRSYDLSAGHFLPILAVVVGAMVPVICIGLVLSVPQLIFDLIAASRAGVLHWPSSFDDFHALMNGIGQRRSVWWDIPDVTLEFLSTMLVWALAASTAVFSYRVLSPTGPAGSAQTF